MTSSTTGRASARHNVAPAPSGCLTRPSASRLSARGGQGRFVLNNRAGYSSIHRSCCSRRGYVLRRRQRQQDGNQRAATRAVSHPA